MNRTQIAAFLVAVGGTVAGGFAALSSLLSTTGAFVAECAPPDGDCVISADPRLDQCAVLLEGGGDRPGEVSGLDGEGAAAARALFAMMEGGAISGFHTIPATDGTSGCTTVMFLTRTQAAEWRETLAGVDAGIGDVVDGAAAVFTPTNPVGAPIQWGGGPTPEQRTEAYDLTPTDGGVP
jgi:hypothetical protein